MRPSLSTTRAASGIKATNVPSSSTEGNVVELISSGSTALILPRAPHDTDRRPRTLGALCSARAARPAGTAVFPPFLLYGRHRSRWVGTTTRARTDRTQLSQSPAVGASKRYRL